MLEIGETEQTADGDYKRILYDLEPDVDGYRYVRGVAFAPGADEVRGIAIEFALARDALVMLRKLVDRASADFNGSADAVPYRKVPAALLDEAQKILADLE